MNVVHPRDLGSYSNPVIKDLNLPYAILVGNNHGSHRVQQNIARIYAHYARNNGLTLLGIEGVGQDVPLIKADRTNLSSLEIKAGRPFSISQKRKLVETIVEPRPERVYTDNTHYGYIRAIADILGYELEMFDISPPDRTQILKEIIRSNIGKVSKEEGMRIFDEALESPEVSQEMFKTFIEKLLHSGKEIGMFISGATHLDDMVENLHNLPFNYVTVFPKGMGIIDSWLAELYIGNFLENIKPD